MCKQLSLYMVCARTEINRYGSSDLSIIMKDLQEAANLGIFEYPSNPVTDMPGEGAMHRAMGQWTRNLTVVEPSILAVLLVRLLVLRSFVRFARGLRLSPAHICHMWALFQLYPHFANIPDDDDIFASCSHRLRDHPVGRCIPLRI
jgi:hypothetical protein